MCILPLRIISTILFIHLFKKYFLSSYVVPGTVSRPEENIVRDYCVLPEPDSQRFSIITLAVYLKKQALHNDFTKN